MKGFLKKISGAEHRPIAVTSAFGPSVRVCVCASATVCQCLPEMLLLHSSGNDLFLIVPCWHPQPPGSCSWSDHMNTSLISPRLGKPGASNVACGQVPHIFIFCFLPGTFGKAAWRPQADGFPAAARPLATSAGKPYTAADSDEEPEGDGVPTLLRDFKSEGSAGAYGRPSDGGFPLSQGTT